MKFFTDAKLRAGSILREMKEKREERKAQKQAAAIHSEHGHGRFFLLTVPATATICAAIVEVYWAFLFCIEATGHLAFDFSTAIGSDAAASGAWSFAFVVNSVAVLVGLALATVPIVMISMVWLPVQFTMRGTGRWRRGTMIFCGLLANVLVIVSGTVVMNGNRQEQVRESVVVEQTAAQGRAAIDARLQFEQEQLRLALNNSNPYLNQAANVGAAEWERSYVAQARASNDPRLPMLERALGAARAADARRANIERLTIERATAAPEAATAATVEDTAGQSLNQFSQAVQVWRPPFVAFICTLVGIFGAWWTLALMQGLNPRDVLRSGWADEGHRIEDLRDQEPIAREPMERQREAVFDADSGEELIPVRATWRKKPKKKGERGQMETAADAPLTERNSTTDGGKRTAVTLGGAMELAQELSHDNVGLQDKANAGDSHGGEAPEAPTSDDLVIPHANAAEEREHHEHLPDNHPEPSDPILSQQEQEDIDAELAAESEHRSEESDPQQEERDIAPPREEVAPSTLGADDASVSLASTDDDVQDHTEEPREPQTDPSRLIAAE